MRWFWFIMRRVLRTQPRGSTWDRRTTLLRPAAADHQELQPVVAELSGDGDSAMSAATVAIQQTNDSAICQATAAGDLGRTVCAGGGASRKGKEESSELSGSIAGGRGRRAGTPHRSAADSRGPFSQSEDAGGVRVFPGPVSRSEPVILLGEAGTGKTHLAPGRALVVETTHNLSGSKKRHSYAMETRGCLRAGNCYEFTTVLVFEVLNLPPNYPKPI
jgi:hypothetical protein